jgi:acyl-CoA synthetase (AMP-forming)/AMP-acid ligase II
MRTVSATTSASSRPTSPPIKGKYFTGDGCRRDEDGYYWITGRVDDVINVSGHRMGTAEVESALVAHPKVAEAAVVGYPHDIKGQGIYAYVTLNGRRRANDRGAAQGAGRLGAQGDRPDRLARLIQWAPGLPKTRSARSCAASCARSPRTRRRARRHLDAGRPRPEALLLALHPGTVRTQLSAPFTSPDHGISPEEAASRLIATIDSATRTGCFLDNAGATIPW